MMTWGLTNMMGGLFGGLGVIWMILVFLFVIAIIAGIIILIIWTVKRSGATHEPYQKSESIALEKLKERYAKGELTKEEYENIKKDIG